MKGLRWLMGLLVLFLALFSYADAQSYDEVLVVKGEVAQEIYTGIGSISSSSQPAYYLRITIQNIGDKIVFFDEALAAFVPRQGKSLRVRTRRTANAPGKTQDFNSYIPGPPFSIAPGRSEKFHFETNGYTEFLLRDSGNSPLMFHFLLIHRKKMLVGPYLAILPPFGQLPESDLRDEAARGRALEFFRPPKVQKGQKF